MYEFRPQKTNNKAQSLIILFFVGAVALLALSMALEGIPFLWAIQLFAILLLVAAIFLVTRYMTKGYIYNIAPADNGADLTVTEVASGGRRCVAVCRISLAGIESARKIEGRDAELREIKRARKKIYDYRPDIEPAESILVEAEECGEKFIILLAYDLELYDILRKDRDGRDI